MPDEGDDQNPRPTEGSERTRKFLALAHERFKMAEEAESDWRKDALEDFQFYAGDQWPADLKTMRSGQRKPILTINRLKQFKRIITNEQRQQRPAIQVNPCGDGSTVDTAQIQQGIVRHVEVGSEAEVAYDMGFESMVIGGLGYIGLSTKYASDKSFSQEIRIDPKRNPFMIYYDPNCRVPDGSDARFAFEIDDMTPEAFRQAYPQAAVASLESFGSIGDKAKDWLSKDHVRVASYFHVEDEQQTIYQLADGSIVSELQPGQEAIKSRKVKVPQVKCAKITALDIMEEADVVFNSIPLIPITGEDIDINGKRHLAGMVRDAKEPQRAFNYFESAKAEAVGLAPKAPFTAYEEVIEGHEEEWRNANTTNYSVLLGKAIYTEGGLLPLPVRNTAEPPIQAMAMLSAGAAANLQAVTGINDANLGQHRQDESGKAVLARQKQGDIGTLHYSDNLSRSLRRLGRMIIAAIPKVYDVPTIMRIGKADGTFDHVITHMGADQTEAAQQLQAQNPAIAKLFDLSVGTYDVSIAVGPSYQTKRQEAVASITALIGAAPQLIPIVGDLLVGNMDWNNAPEIAKRLKKLVPPNVLDDENGDPAVEAQQAAAKAQQMEQQIQMLTQALHQAAEEIKTKKLEQDTKLQVAQMDNATRLAIAEITTKAQEPKLRAEIELELWKSMHDSAHDSAMQAGQQQHQADLATQAQSAQAQQATQAQQAQQAQAEQAQQQQQTQI